MAENAPSPPDRCDLDCVFLVRFGDLAWSGILSMHGDWHWQVREKLGQFDMPNSYVKFLVDSITGLDLNANLVDISTLLLFIMALLAAIYANLRDWRISKIQE